MDPFFRENGLERFHRWRNVSGGKYSEAVEFAFKEMEKGPIKRNTYPHPTISAFLMHLDFPKTRSVKDYLRTLDLESSEAKAYWTDEHGEWLRQTFTSRPDNVVVRGDARANSAPAGILVAKPQPGTANCDLRLPEGKPVEIRLRCSSLRLPKATVLR